MAQMESKGLTQPAGGGWDQPERRTRWVVTADSEPPTLSHPPPLNSVSQTGGSRPESILSPKPSEVPGTSQVSAA